jgi:hypothetical protein
MSIETLRRERGESKIAGIVTLLLLAAFAYALFNVAPAFVSDYNLKDQIVQVARLGRGGNPDEAITERLMKAVREEGLTDFIGPRDFKINTRDSSRKITVEYERTLNVLPGYKRNFKFSHEVDEPSGF